VIECTLEAETSASNSTQYKLFIGDDKKCTLSRMTFSFNNDVVFASRKPIVSLIPNITTAAGLKK